MTAFKIEVPISIYTVNRDDDSGNFGFKFQEQKILMIS